MAGHAAQLKFGEDALISYLPLSHIAAQIIDIYMPILYGASLHFAQPDALKVHVLCLILDVSLLLFRNRTNKLVLKFYVCLDIFYFEVKEILQHLYCMCL